MRNLFVLSFIIFGFASTVAAQPCTSATPECTRWVKLGGESRSLVYSNYPLDKKNEKITRALIVVHGAGRDADNYFRTTLAATFLANALENTIAISPRFASNNGGCPDTLAANEVNWPCGGDSWRSGGVATNNGQLTSYDFMDAIVRALTRKENFPNLKSIVISGHSAGGQFATRYGMANQIHDSAGVPITYVVSNPSSYSYLDPERPAGANNEQRPFGEARNCTTYDNWPYGFKNRTGYASKIPDDQLKKQMAARPMTYLLGELDVLPLAGFDSSCPAMAQGPTRLARGQAYAAYVKAKYNAPHQVVVVPLCGHNARCVFTSEAALPVLFPKM
ncbi:MAG TPA: alpha/beta fold hydrolase [Pyrinomonadaceae bacterium]|nr:alpha/beta fold hydrolase [Pyrinomonadaceae bacterium]